MKTLVTGAPGWLGTRLVEALTGTAQEFLKFSAFGGREVRALVQPGIPADELHKMGVEVLRGDIRDMSACGAAVKGMDTIFHCVGIIHPKRVKDLYEINTEGTKKLLSCAIAAGVKRFVFISSNSPAGCNQNPERLLVETDAPNPYKNYGKSKLYAELALRSAGAKGAIEVVILRPCWFYGPNQPARQSRFFNMIKSGHPMIFGDGKNLRSMSYVDNTVQAMLLAEGKREAAGETYWVADERPYQTIEIYQTVAELLGVELKPRFIPGLASEVCEVIDNVLQAAGFYFTDFHVAGEMNKNIACSIEKAKRELGYAPTIDLREGMRRSIEWCRKRGMEI